MKPTYFIAELSCNHHGSIDKALELVNLAHQAGANAVKTQTYTGDTITLKSDNAPFFMLFIGYNFLFDFTFFFLF